MGEGEGVDVRRGGLLLKIAAGTLSSYKQVAPSGRTYRHLLCEDAAVHSNGQKACGHQPKTTQKVAAPMFFSENAPRAGGRGIRGRHLQICTTSSISQSRCLRLDSLNTQQQVFFCNNH